ncbi:DUF4279 domain-containing protein [Streptomyces sp. NPDC050738]|uniref:DUF4279 domain-containing protein n=1 Tax=Streptomyces sp. NPDC050738 TaxID=3154744 RepID=UPI0034173B31
MPLHQYVYFALFSRHTSAAEMAELLGIEPDEVSVRGSRSTHPAVIPVEHSWKIVCREPGLRVDEQVAHVLDRLRPHADRIAGLAGQLSAEESGGAVLEIVRYFNDVEHDQEQLEPDSPEQPPHLFGWHLDSDVLAFLAATGAALDVDEYDMTPDEGIPAAGAGLPATTAEAPTGPAEEDRSR